MWTGILSFPANRPVFNRLNNFDSSLQDYCAKIFRLQTDVFKKSLVQGWGKCGLFEEFVRPSNCLLTSPYFLNYVLLVCISRTFK